MRVRESGDTAMLSDMSARAAVYTTVGFGDITPEGPMRILVCIEALAGLVLITWSASFTFLVMQGYWRDRLGGAAGGD